MTAAYRSADAVVGTTTPANFTIPSDGSVAAGDVLWVAYLVAALETVDPPADFEQVGDQEQDNGDTWVLARKVLEASDLGAQKTFAYTDPGGTFPHSGMVWLAVSGVDSTTPEDADPVFTLESSSTTAHDVDGITTVTDGAYVFNLLMERGASANASFTASTGTVKKSAISSGSSVVEGCAVDHGTTTVGSGKGACTITAASVATAHAGAWTIAARPTLATQVVGLTADVTVTGWTAVPSGATNLVDRISDDSDTTYVESSANPTDLVFRGSVSSDLAGVPARVRVRCELAAGATAGSVKIQLIQTGDEDTVVAERTETGITGSWADYLLTLTGDEQDDITDYTALDVALTCSVTA